MAELAVSLAADVRFARTGRGTPLKPSHRCVDRTRAIRAAVPLWMPRAMATGWSRFPLGFGTYWTATYLASSHSSRRSSSGVIASACGPWPRIHHTTSASARFGRIGRCKSPCPLRIGSPPVGTCFVITPLPKSPTIASHARHHSGFPCGNPLGAVGAVHRESLCVE
jgi:hypothetical protein